MSDTQEIFEPLATEAGQDRIAQAIANFGSLSNALRAETAANTATQKAAEARAWASSDEVVEEGDELSNIPDLYSAKHYAEQAEDIEALARKWATKMDTYVAQETITIPAEQEGEEDTTETVNLYSAKYYAALAEDYFNQSVLDSSPTQNSTNGITSGGVYTALATKQDILTFDNSPTQNSVNPVKSGGVYSALDLKADKSTTYTKTEVDTQIGTAVSNLVNSAPSTLDTLEELANALGDDPNFATTIATQLGNKADKSTTYTKTEVDTALSGKQNTLTFDTTPTQNSTKPVTSGGVYTALQGIGTGDVTLNTDQNITGTKTFVGQKKILFKQSTSTDKLGFTFYTNNDVEKGFLEFSPNRLVDNIPILTLGNFANNSEGITHVGFRKYSEVSGSNGIYNLLTPLISDAKSPFNLNIQQDTIFYFTLGVTNGTTMVKTDKRGVLNISSLLPTVPTKVSDLTNDSGFITGVSWSNVTSKPTFATVATSGSYSDLSDKPTIDSTVTQNGTNPVSGAGIYSAIQTAINSITNANGVSY